MAVSTGGGRTSRQRSKCGESLVGETARPVGGSRDAARAAAGVPCRMVGGRITVVLLGRRRTFLAAWLVGESQWCRPDSGGSCLPRGPLANRGGAARATDVLCRVAGRRTAVMPPGRRRKFLRPVRRTRLGMGLAGFVRRRPST
ncbi:hypothetical protein ACFPN7_04215 [Amycolatopsis halotolerans]|uniref:hypothetical protein n=1 Tax=Amycolatopsis halotolerans TaxID=330083 RepID=UPI00361C55B0